MYLFLEKIHIGISYISKRYSKSKEDINIMYWDTNNLYGWAMGCNYLPYGGFKWLSKEEIKKFDIFSGNALHSIKENSKIGYILEVDLEYCQELRDIHNDYPLCPEHISVNYGMLSNYCKDIVDKFNIKVGNVKKLIPNLYDKIRYPVHYKNLQYYLKLGMKLIKINFISQKIIDNNLVAVHCGKKILSLNKPIYVGFCILELSKLMYQFHYDYALKTFDNVKLLFTDTDSLVYEIKDENVYEQCFKDKELFDFSGYSKDSIYFDDSNKKKLGKMKDEFNGNKTDEFLGLKSKTYSLISNNLEMNKAKDVNLKLKHKEYVDVLFNKKVLRHKMKRILSEKHNIGSYLLNKISLSCYDDKIFFLNDGINSLAYGHKNID